MRVSVLLCLVLLALAEAGRSRGGGSRRGGGGGGLFGGLFGGRKSSSRPSQPSYPKQTYTNTGSNNNGNFGSSSNSGGIGGGGFVNPNNRGGSSSNSGGIGGGGFVNPNNNRGSSSNNGGIGGGGFVNPNNNRGSSSNNGGIGGGGFVNPNNRGNNFGNNRNNYGSNNYGNNRGYNSMPLGGGYYSGGSFKPSGGLFGSGGKKAFALGAGAGFIGGAVAAAGAMSVYHHYRQYQALMMYKGAYGYGNYGPGYNYSPYGNNGLLVRQRECVGGCPSSAFCDYAICRCKSGYEARFGSCYNDFQKVYENKKDEFDARTKDTFDPYIKCGGHQECMNLDMNLVCNSTTSKCQCREDMKWNGDVGECQIYLDVNCTAVDPKVMPQTQQTNSTGILDEEVKTSEGNVTTANETLSDSSLTKIDVNETSVDEIKALFCKEIGVIASRYEQPQIPNNRFGNNNGFGTTRRDVEKAALGAGVIALIILLVCCCCGCLCICVCIQKIKDIFAHIFEDGNESVRGHDNQYKSDDNSMPMETPAGYDPAYSAQPLYPPVAGDGYPSNNGSYPPSNAIYPPNNAPYPQNDGPYPPNFAPNPNNGSVPYPAGPSSYPPPYQPTAPNV